MKTSYHNHTFRCKHATGSDEEYIKAAIDAKMDEFGMSDHMPSLTFPDCKYRMYLDQEEDYLNSFINLRKIYSNAISIKLGFECEYYDKDHYKIKGWTENPEIDYLILSQHYRQSDYFWYGQCKTSKEMYDYLDELIKGMATGFYNFIGHPDLYLESYRKWDELTSDVASKLCEAALHYKLPLEFNVGGIRNKNFYPNDDFFKIVKKHGCEVIINSDAHNPKHVYDEFVIDARKRAEKLELKIIDKLIL